MQGQCSSALPYTLKTYALLAQSGPLRQPEIWNSLHLGKDRLMEYF